MEQSDIKARFGLVDFAGNRKLDSALFYGCVRNPLRAHTYFVIDLREHKCHRIEVSSRYSLASFYRGLRAVVRNNYRDYKRLALLRTLFQDGTYHLKQWALLVGANLPHYANPIGDKRFWIGSAGTCNALICDLERQRVTSLVPLGQDVLLGAQISYFAETGEVYFLAYDVRGPNQIGLVDPAYESGFTVNRYNTRTGAVETLWSGRLNCLLVDGFQVTADRRYAIFSDLRFALDEDNQFDPSSIYIIDLESGTKWEIPNLKASAHIALDPDDPSVFYATEHEIGIITRDKVTEADEAKNRAITLFARLKFVTKEIGGFVGEAALHKYRMTADGPVRLGTFRDGRDFVRATWHVVFKRRGRKLIGTISSPYILIIDAETMQLYKKIDTGVKPVYGLHVSEDGEEFYCNTFYDFYVIDFETGQVQATMNFQERKKGRVFHVSTHTARADLFHGGMRSDA